MIHFSFSDFNNLIIRIASLFYLFADLNAHLSKLVTMAIDMADFEERLHAVELLIAHQGVAEPNPLEIFQRYLKGTKQPLKNLAWKRKKS